MKVSRRKMLAMAPAAAALALAPHVRWNEHVVVDVKTFGATGDGTTDDSPAIRLAMAAIQSGCTLHFPAGTYRFAQRWPVGGAAIVISRVTDVAVEFAPGAELFMDNLDPVTRTGTSHGVLIRGQASRISLRDIRIRWTDGAIRSLGDGIRAEGFATLDGVSPTGWSGRPTPIDGITLSNCTVQASPQTGVVMHGVSNIAVDGLRVVDSAADGLHFNACRRARIANLHTTNTGDDGLALVTYLASQPSFDEAAHTFAFPSLTEWSNADFTVDDVDVIGGHANGVRIAGAQRLRIGGLRVTGVRSGSAVMIDSAEPGTDVGWNYVASRAIRVDDVTATKCDTGIHILARASASGGQQFTDFDVTVGRAQLDECDNWSVRAESLADNQVSGLRVDDCNVSSTSSTGGNGGVGIDQARGITLGDISIRHSDPVVVFSVVDAERLAVARLDVAIDMTEPPAEDAKPAVTLDHSDGAIDHVDITWPAAPSSWNAVRLSGTGLCETTAPVTIGSLNVTPALDDPTIGCS